MRGFRGFLVRPYLLSDLQKNNDLELALRLYDRVERAPNVYGHRRHAETVVSPWFPCQCDFNIALVRQNNENEHDAYYASLKSFSQKVETDFSIVQEREEDEEAEAYERRRYLCGMVCDASRIASNVYDCQMTSQKSEKRSSRCCHAPPPPRISLQRNPPTGHAFPLPPLSPAAAARVASTPKNMRG